MNNNFEQFMHAYFDNFKETKIREAMEYSLFGDGKRFRPNLIFAIVKGFGLDETRAYHAALALEMIHTYSLIHDDLPCMDDDDFRRGRPSNHIQFGEDIATLSGDGLLTGSFKAIVTDPLLSDSQKVKIVALYSEMAGANGMIHGQLLDLESENSSEVSAKMLDDIQDYKTGCLFKSALLAGMYIVKDEENREFYETMAKHIGRIFQIQDDLFDITKTQEETGKPVKSDLKNNKATALSIYTIAEIKERLENEFNAVDALIAKQSFDTEAITNIINVMKNR